MITAENLQQRNKEYDIISEKFKLLLEQKFYKDISSNYKIKNKEIEFVFSYIYNGYIFLIKIYYDNEIDNKFYANIKCYLTKHIIFENDFCIKDNFLNNSALIRLMENINLFTDNILKIIEKNKDTFKHISDDISYKTYDKKENN